uniref:Coiled-coil domain containing 112 n=1 Tax=Ornithorhynchus anatinus TaxID=9258 RepID=K7E8P1_ORNAN
MNEARAVSLGATRVPLSPVWRNNKDVVVERGLLSNGDGVIGGGASGLGGRSGQVARHRRPGTVGRAAASLMAGSRANQGDRHFHTSDGGPSVLFQPSAPHFEKAEKIEAMRRVEKLKVQLDAIENSLNSHFCNRKNNLRIERSKMAKFNWKLTNRRELERTSLLQQLAKIHINVINIQNQLKDGKPTPKHVEKVRIIMTDIENAIDAFKEKQQIRYEDLSREEKKLTKELDVLKRKIEMWSLGDSGTGRASRGPLCKVVIDKGMQSNLSKEVVKFEKFLQHTGGRQGGWDVDDHQTFLKVKTKYRRKPSYIEEILEYFPGKTKEDVQQHDTWYQEYLLLEKRKKESIQKWKAEKQLKREEILKPKPVLKMGKTWQELVQKEKKEAREKQKMALEAWKIKKMIEMAVKRDLRLKEEEEHKRKQQKEQQHQLQVKQLLESYIQKKKQQEFLRQEKMREDSEKETKRRSSVDEISKFQERVEVNVRRDPSRVHRPTKGWEEKIKGRRPVSEGQLMSIPHRALPSWRQGLSRR